MTPAFKKASDLMDGGIVDLCTENEALKNK